MAAEASLIVNCPYCGKPCSCRLQGGVTVCWFTCPHCRTKRFYVQITVGREVSQAAPQPVEPVPRLKCLTVEYDTDEFARAVLEDLRRLESLKPSPAVEAAEEQLFDVISKWNELLQVRAFRMEVEEQTDAIRSIGEALEAQLSRRKQGRRRRVAVQPPLLGPATSPTESRSMPPQSAAPRLGSSACGGSPPVQVSGYGCLIVRVGTHTVVVREKCERCGHVDSSTQEISKPTPNSRITGAFTCFKCGAHQDWAVEGN